ncbi:hypothetical protein [Chishuiella sp.]|uniref:hypothetical protein n=1 Tax=Chishuiella sp. TaxID=1969467 RepID=UPI0028AF875C|nr:hypothetical protein [Chishuiella sp.]
MKTHEENLLLYLENGGDSKIANKFKLPTIPNRAKISYLLTQQKPMEKKLNQVELEVAKKSVESAQNVTEVFEPSKPTFLGFISQYPTELHSAYQSCYNSWLEVCSLKIQLNDVTPLDIEDAYAIQLKMFKSISKFDINKNSLDYWNENKRILPTESKKDYSKFTPLELDQERRNLSSLITRRKQTIAKKESELPNPEALDYRKKYETIQLKKEQLEELILDQNKIKELLHVL